MTAATRGEFIRSIPFPNEARARFGPHLHAAMCARSMTSKQLALVAGVADPTIKQMISGTINNHANGLSMYVIVGLADGLGIDPSEVVGWAQPDMVIAKKHFDEARPKARERSARYRAQAEAEIRRNAATEADPAPVFVTRETPRRIEPVFLAPEVSIASVMLKLRGLSADDLVIVDELLSGLTS